MLLAFSNQWDLVSSDWFTTDCILHGQKITTKQFGMPSLEQWSKGITIPDESPIWDAVKVVQ